MYGVTRVKRSYNMVLQIHRTSRTSHDLVEHVEVALVHRLPPDQHALQQEGAQLCGHETFVGVEAQLQVLSEPTISTKTRHFFSYDHGASTESVTHLEFTLRLSRALPSASSSTLACAILSFRDCANCAGDTCGTSSVETEASGALVRCRNRARAVSVLPAPDSPFRMIE
jgi:hypothetical protein